ncbi:OmpA family protein [uncultured Roseibium sp.]|uniref:OmpA family protein n=1 Tax=uncultured Roseibium sp. TaxID=1936171 RepID=UPI002613BB02|nr:OmpA family protein [uncultured Roseibium sp.]
MSELRAVLAVLLLAGIAFLASPVVRAQADGIFDDGWTLQPDASSLRFQSVKNLTQVESSSFAEFEGKIEENGDASVRIFLDSIDTKIDLRNVRMRFLFFETFEFPSAVISTNIDPTVLSDLPERKRKIIPLTFSLKLHGVEKTLTSEVAVTLMSDDLVAVSSTAPISVAASDFGLDSGVKKLEEAADVVIVPSATVSFDFVFAKNQDDDEARTASAEPAKQSELAAAKALEPEGDFDLEACTGRFEILSRTDNIYFTSGSSGLDPRSEPFLNSLVDIVARCPGLVIEVAGHTDSVGRAAANMRLSQRRATAVMDYLVSKDIPDNRIRSVGYGETQPVASNNTPEGKRRNRRIEFSIVE